MSKDAKNVPALRFKGYSDAWEKRKLGEVVERVTRKNRDLVSTRPLTISAQDGLVDQRKFFSKTVASKNISNYFLLKAGDFAYNKSYSVGYPWGAVKRLDKYPSGVLSTLYIVFKPKKINSQFLVTYFEGTTWYVSVSKVASEGARNHGLLNISASDFFDQQLFFPTKKTEQESIGLTIKVLDDLIAATQHSIDALEQAKKALLQRLFDQSWRFKGYSDPWEKRKLGEVATITMGQSPDSKNYTLNPQDHILVQGNADIKNGWVEPRVWTTQITKIAKKGSVLLSVRAPVGEVSKTAFDVVLGRGVASVGQTDFLYQYLITLKINGFWLRYSTGSTFDSINSADIKDAIIFLPEKNEQSRIAKTLNCIDNLIAATQSRLSSLELLKKALLQDLFI